MPCCSYPSLALLSQHRHRFNLMQLIGIISAVVMALLVVFGGFLLEPLPDVRLDILHTSCILAICTCMCVYVCVCTCMLFVHICLCVYMYVCMCVCMHLCVCVCVCACVVQMACACTCRVEPPALPRFAYPTCALFVVMLH